MDKNASFGALHAQDALNRRLPTSAEAGALRADRYVGAFYFLTHGVQPGARIGEVSRIERECPEAKKDFDHPAWGDVLYWGEPLYGFYSLEDQWVLRRHVKMLTHAGIDFLIFDTTNRETFFPWVKMVLKALDEYRCEGFRVPQIVYYTNTRSGDTVEEIYHDLYAPGLYPELWFMWEGKPLIIGTPEECSAEARSFFTFRQPQWPTERMKAGGFPWIDFERPQRAWAGPDGQNEVVPVSVAQHPNLSFGDAALYGDPGALGRSYHTHRQDKSHEAIGYGYNVAEQWERAIELDPKIVFFTGWNEWTVGRSRGDEPRPVNLVDQADDEFSRDVEPMKGGFFDNYYLQLCDYVRRFKGAPPLPAAHTPISIELDGKDAQWEGAAEYWPMPFGALHRDAPGVDGRRYLDSAGRNEFELLRVAHDEQYLYFYARTRDEIEFNMFTRWMTLYIGIEGRPFAPQWHGYHYLVNDIVLDRSATFLQTCLGGDRWGGNLRVPMCLSGRELTIRLPRAELGLSDGPNAVYFKWADHAGRSIEEFYMGGDSAPFGRFSYLYRMA